MICHGAELARFYKDDCKSSWAIVDRMIKNASLHGIDADMAALGAGIGDMREFEGKSS